MGSVRDIYVACRWPTRHESTVMTSPTQLQSGLIIMEGLDRTVVARVEACFLVASVVSCMSPAQDAAWLFRYHGRGAAEFLPPCGSASRREPLELSMTRMRSRHSNNEDDRFFEAILIAGPARKWRRSEEPQCLLPATL